MPQWVVSSEVLTTQKVWGNVLFAHFQFSQSLATFVLKLSDYKTTHHMTHVKCVLQLYLLLWAWGACGSVVLTWSPCACLPITMASSHPGTSLGTVWQMIGSRNTVPPKMLRIVPLGLRHIFFNLNSVTNLIHCLSDTANSLYCSLYLKAFDWLRPTTLFFLFYL